MDLFVLDGNLRKTDFVDRFDSLVWKDSWNGMGDFELDIHSNTRHRRWLTPGRLLHTPLSYHVMVVETTEDHLTSAGEYMMKVKGRSLEKLLDERIAAILNPTWEVTGTPGNIARKIVDDICRLGTLDPKDKIPYLGTGGSFYPESTIPEAGEEITLEFEPENVYTLVKNIADAYDLGFRLGRNPFTEELRFSVYTGVDRTTSVASNKPIVFSIEMGNMDNSTLLKSWANYRNVVMVTSAQGRRIVTSSNDEANLSGFNRRMLLVKNSDITVDWPSMRAEMRMLLDGKAALAASRKLIAFDGELSKFDSYEYVKDYYLGDMVELRGDDGHVSYMRVVEQILVSDANGDRSYPTLELRETVTPGSWLSQDGNGSWADMTWLGWVDADLLSGAGNAPNLSPDPNFEDLSKWRGTGNFALVYIDGHRGLHVWENSGQAALYVDSTEFFPCVPGDIAYASVEVKVTVPNNVRMQFIVQDGATMLDDPPARKPQVPADGWVKYSAICRMGGTAGTFRAIVWPDGMNLPIGEGFYIRNYQVSRL